MSKKPKATAAERVIQYAERLADPYLRAKAAAEKAIADGIPNDPRVKRVASSLKWLFHRWYSDDDNERFGLGDYSWSGDEMLRTDPTYAAVT